MRETKTIMPAAFNVERLLAPRQAVVAFLSRAELKAPGVEEVPLDLAFDRILAADAIARRDHPAHPRSTMDGFAVAAKSGRAARRITGAVLMGHAPPGSIGPFEAMRIPTGGVVPDGADAVVPAEDAVETGGSIVPGYDPAPGEFVTPRGSDVPDGERVLLAGRRIGPAELGVLAALGVARVSVFRRPRIALITTGDELVEPGAEPRTGQVRDSNRFAIGGSLRALGCDVVPAGPIADEPAMLRSAIELALGSCDGVVLSGGSSVGERDLVPRIVAGLGEPGVIVHGLRVKPGKPTMLAAIGGKPVLGLPGNPTSALMMLEAVGSAAIAAVTGETPGLRRSVTAVASEPFLGREGWTWYMPVHLEPSGDRLSAAPLRLHSAHVALLARAHGYAVVGEQRFRIEPGETVEVFAFGSGGPPIGDRR
jgi:molybdenum cofactor synthesis domain-containing protein